ncbi:unnamed protein product [Paramecium octaurelia]|uniref:Uncharacterized protein n=1 Tax=Paramecium octaurelia TaxID=43137 RepID=A0A8S1XGQ9_PAROT|nr:unnamed protein product [Paramecium octaurelia]
MDLSRQPEEQKPIQGPNQQSKSPSVMTKRQDNCILSIQVLQIKSQQFLSNIFQEHIFLNINLVQRINTFHKCILKTIDIAELVRIEIRKSQYMKWIQMNCFNYKIKCCQQLNWLIVEIEQGSMLSDGQSFYVIVNLNLEEREYGQEFISSLWKLCNQANIDRVFDKVYQFYISDFGTTQKRKRKYRKGLNQAKQI